MAVTDRIYWTKPQQQTTPTQDRIYWTQPKTTTITPPSPTQPGGAISPFGISPLGVTTGLEESIKAAQQTQERQESITRSVPLTYQDGQKVSTNLFPVDFGLPETLQNTLFNLLYEGEDIVSWEARPQAPDIKPIELSFRQDPQTGNIFAYSDFKTGIYDATKDPVGTVDSKTGQINFDMMFMLQTRGYYTRAYGGAVPITTPVGEQVYLTDKVQKFLNQPQVVGTEVYPSITQQLGTVGLIGSIVLMAPQAIQAIRGVVSSATSGILDRYIQTHSKDILILNDRMAAAKQFPQSISISTKDRLLYSIYSFHNNYITLRAAELIKKPSPAIETAISTVTQTTENIVNAIASGKEVTTTSITDLIVTGTPTEFTSGITSIIAGQAITTAMAEWTSATENAWNTMPIPQKVDLVKSVGLEGKVASKEPSYLTQSEKDAIAGAISGEVKPSAVPTEVSRRIEYRPHYNPLSRANEKWTLRNYYGDAIKDDAGLTLKFRSQEQASAYLKKLEPITPEIKPEVPAEKPAIPTVLEKSLRQSIMATVKGKGIAEGKYRDLFKKVGGSKKLTDMGSEQLLKVQESVRELRPKKIGSKNVITAKSEKAISTLKDVLIAEKKLTPEIYEELKKYLGLPTDKYESRELFITERQANSLIRAMNNEADVGLTRWDIAVSEGLANKPEIKTAIDNLSSRITKGAKPRLAKDIPFREVAADISYYPTDVGLSGWMSSLRAMRRFQEQLGGRAVTRIYDVAEMTVEQRRLNDITLANWTNAMRLKLPQLATIIQDKERMTRIQQWLDSDLKIIDIEKPDLTPDELAVAQMGRQEYDSYKDIVRLERFKAAYFIHRGVERKSLPELIKNGMAETQDIAIPDAPIEDIKKAIEVYETKGETGLREYLNTKDWGVWESGYSFSRVLHPQLRMYRRAAVRATTTSLHPRQGLEFLRDERTFWERLISYKRQMINLNLNPYYRRMDMEWAKIRESGLLSPENANDAAKKISLFMREIKGFPIESPIVSIMLRMAGWSFGTLSKVPWMSVRNLHQNIAFAPDKSEIVKAHFEGGFFSDPLTKRGRLDYMDALVHQYKGVQQEQILMGYLGRTPLENLIRRTDYYHLSDKLNRYEIMNGQGRKAEKALIQYLKDKDIQKFLRDSGAIELSATEQIRILEFLAMDSYDYAGVLESVSGSEAAIREIGNKITTLIHLNYVRYLRSFYEMGEIGRVLGSLVAFPRGVTERYADIFSRIKRLHGAELKRAIKALFAMIIGSIIASEMLKWETGKERDAYNPLLILQWQVGGLATGATENIMELYRLITNLTFAEDESQKKYYFDEIILLVPQLGDSFIPFYSVTMNMLESLTDSRYLDREYFRKLREVFDKDYQMNEEYYKIERDLFEKIQHGLFGTNTPEPSDLEKALKVLGIIEPQLGQTIEGEIYTTGNLGSDIDAAIRNLDPSELISENGFSELVLARADYQVIRDKYFEVDADKRYDYRKANPTVDANLFFWSYVTTLQSDLAKSIVRSMISDFGVPTSAIRGYENAFGGGGTTQGGQERIYWTK